ncbi:MAG: Na/Pi cotransporter family protein [Agathobacter sp.]|nr:Na/Pi cotransporter family protein [Agathobacter sp.]
MDIFNILNMIGGLALFLYGMNAMGNGLSKMAGGRLESILERLTTKRIYAVLLGAAVTAVIQSSSATTVMVVGFVNSGIMQLSQVVGIIMGANVGTTITSWLLSLTGIEGDAIWVNLLKPSSFSPVLAAIGIILTMSSKGESKKKDIGNIMLGFAILMFGMETMSGAVSGLKDNEGFTGMLTAFSNNPLLAMLVGAVFTAIIQSSSASVGILQSLCSTGAVSYGTAIPIIMGQNIGTCVTSIISSVGASKNARRASMIHLYFNLIGTMLFMVVFYTLNKIVDFAFMSDQIGATGIAVVHSLFNVGATIVLFPFADKLVKLAKLTIPDGKDEETENAKSLENEIAIDERFLQRPAFAVEICRQKVHEMAKDAVLTLSTALEVLSDYDEDKVKEVYALEDKIDIYEDRLGTYLVKLSGKNLSKKDSQSVTMMIHSIVNLERISDYAKNIVESVETINSKELTFSKKASYELSVLCQAVNDIVNDTVNVFCEDDLEGAKIIEPLEEVIDTLTKKIKKRHVKRLQKGKCTIEMGLILEDILTSLERISDHCSNIAVELLAINEDVYDTHEYYEEMSEAEQALFTQNYKRLKERYSLGKPEEESES